MKKIYYCDISNVLLDDINLSIISNERINKTNKINVNLKKIQSLTSYLLLRYAFKNININLNDYEFSYKNNKPFIKDLPYYFNITHSNNIVAVIISDSEIGIDCEKIDTTKNLDLLINYVLSMEELKEFYALKSNEKYEYFYTKWVMKEAYFKMIGKGLSKEFKNTGNINYPVFKIKDKNNNSYLISTTLNFYQLEEIKFNNINQ